jgi:hypothetical protein
MTSEELGLPLTGATIQVLGPEQDIDHFYLGDEADPALRGLAAMEGTRPPRPAAPESPGPEIVPRNISPAEFRQLRSRMVSSAFAFAELSSRVTNNTSVVLLIEWRKKRLLFVGDAEWDARFKEGKSNGSWNVMWNRRRDLLDQAVDFLKIGHHGSENATPWNDGEDGGATEPAAILDAILPLPARRRGPTAKAIVSTERGRYKTIPRAELLVELGKRVESVRNYQSELKAAGVEAKELPHFREFEKAWLDAPQPLRTDCEQMLSGAAFVEVELEE